MARVHSACGCPSCEREGYARELREKGRVNTEFEAIIRTRYGVDEIYNLKLIIERSNVTVGDVVRRIGRRVW